MGGPNQVDAVASNGSPRPQSVGSLPMEAGASERSSGTGGRSGPGPGMGITALWSLPRGALPKSDNRPSVASVISADSSSRESRASGAVTASQAPLWSRFVGVEDMGALAVTAMQDLTERRPAPAARVRSERQDWSAQRNLLGQVIESTAYELCLAVVIVINIVVIIMETDARAAHRDTEHLGVVSRFFFLPLYGMELMVRLYIYRYRFLDYNWNVLDASVVIIDVIVEIFSALFEDAEELPAFSLFRVLRLCRLARFARVMVIFKELHMMLHAFLSAMKTMFWACFMLAFLLTLFSILAVEIVHPVNLRLADRGEYVGCDRCVRAFETVLQANLTFMQQIIAGDSWGQLSVPIIEEEPFTAIILISALVMINLGVLNLILTVIVNAAHEARMNDKRLQAEENIQRFEAHKTKLLKICAALDVNSDGFLSIRELTDAIDTNVEFRHICEAIDIRKDDVQVIYAFLDADQDGLVTYTEFVEQVFKIKSMDVHAFLVTLRGALNQLAVDVKSEIRDLKHEVNIVRKTQESYGVASARYVALAEAQRSSVEAVEHALTAQAHLSGQSISSTRPMHHSPSEGADGPRLRAQQHLSGRQADSRHHHLHTKCWADVDQELTSLRHRLDEDMTTFVTTMLAKLDKQTKAFFIGELALPGDTPSPGSTWGPSLALSGKKGSGIGRMASTSKPVEPGSPQLPEDVPFREAGEGRIEEGPRGTKEFGPSPASAANSRAGSRRGNSSGSCDHYYSSTGRIEHL